MKLGSQKVSQVDWCLGRRMAGPAGRLSQPLTCQVTPHSARAARMAKRVHMAATW